MYHCALTFDNYSEDDIVELDGKKYINLSEEIKVVQDIYTVTEVKTSQYELTDITDISSNGKKTVRVLRWTWQPLMNSAGWHLSIKNKLEEF